MSFCPTPSQLERKSRRSELGMMMAMGKRVFGSRNTALLYHQRVQDDGYVVEKFGLGDNLMIDCAILEAGGMIAAEDELANCFEL